MAHAKFDVQSANFCQITHLFRPYSQNKIIKKNSECKRLFCRVEGGDAHWRLCRRPVVTGRAEPQEGSGIRVRAWIEDLKVYPGIPMPNDGAGA